METEINFAALSDEELAAYATPPQGHPLGEPHEAGAPGAESLAVYESAIAEQNRRAESARFDAAVAAAIARIPRPVSDPVDYNGTAPESEPAVIGAV